MAQKYVKQFGTGSHSLKIGKSFEKNNATAYHSIRYDFKPSSIDESREGSLEVEEKSSVSVTLPHTDGLGSTNFKGSAKPANNKDCVLIIDWETGEFRLERVSNQILLKKTREKNPGANCDSMNNDVKDSMKELMMSSPEKKGHEEISNTRIKIEHDSDHPRAREPHIKKETDDLRQQQSLHKRSDFSHMEPKMKQESPSPVKVEKATVFTALDDTQGLGLGLSDSSDDSDSDSSSGSQSDSSTPSSTILRKGHLPTARPQKPHKIHAVKQEFKVFPPVQSSMPSVFDESSSFEQKVKSFPPDASSAPVVSKPYSASSMPSIGFDESLPDPNMKISSSNSPVPLSAASIRSSDLGEDLELSDSDSD